MTATINVSGLPASTGRSVPARLFRHTEAILLLCILLVALALRLHTIESESLWLDEVYSATFAVQNLFDLIVATWRFDTHPPLYYVQLHFWAMVSTNTIWLFVNTVAWSVGSVVSIWYAARRSFDARTGLLAAAILAVLPAEIVYSHQLRMYAMVTCLGIWCWHFANEALLRTRSRRAFLLVGLFEVAVTYSHMSGLVTVFMFAVYGLLLAYLSNVGFPIIRRWVITQALVAVLGLPVLINSAVRSLSHVVAPGLGRVAETLGFLVFGQAGSSSSALQAAAILGFLLLIASAATPRMRATVFALLLFPLVAEFVASHLLRPMWIERGFLFMLPFIALSAATALIRAEDFLTQRLDRVTARAAWSALAAAFLLLFGVYGFRAFDIDFKGAPYAPAAKTIAAGLRPGDVVYVPNFVSFWGIAWYLVGPEWGSPLAIQDPQRETRSDIWPKLLQRMGPVWRRRLDLEPKARTIDWKGAQLVIGLSPPAQMATASRLWLVERQEPDVDMGLFHAFTQRSVIEDKGLVVRLLERTPGSASTLGQD
jgi:mannosyltransferase